MTIRNLRQSQTSVRPAP